MIKNFMLLIAVFRLRFNTLARVAHDPSFWLDESIANKCVRIPVVRLLERL